jgi:outer membrane protein OmpA-like peptidoglycan-associated protein
MKTPSMLARSVVLLSGLLLVVSGCQFDADPSSGMRTLVPPIPGTTELFILINQHSPASMRATEAFAVASVRPGERLVILSVQDGAVLASSTAPLPPSTGIPAPPPPLGVHPTAFKKARHSQAVQQYQQTVGRAWAALRSQQHKALSAWAASTVASAFSRPILESAGEINLDEDLGAVAADLSSLRQADGASEAGIVIAITGITGSAAQSAPTLPTGLQGSTVVADDFPGSISEEAAWQGSLLQAGASRVVLLTSATDDQMAAVVAEGLDDAVTDTLSSVLFRLGQYTIQTAALPQLSHLLYLLTVKYPQATVTINGYTDSVPTAIAGGNLRLSRLRAEQVQQWLIAHAVAANRIQAFGYGNTDPVAPNTPDGQPLNRRVVVVIDPATAAGAG